MAKFRSIHTKFWSDNWVRINLNPLDRYIFLYFLSNEHCNLCGIYELPITTMAFETGIAADELERSFLPRLEPKIQYRDGWVYILNFDKYHVEGSPKLKIGFEREKNEVPSRILELFGISGKGMDTLSPLSLSLSSTLLVGETKVSHSGGELEQPPSFEDWITTEGYELTEVYGGEEVGDVVGYMHSSRKAPFSEADVRAKYARHLKGLANPRRRTSDKFDFDQGMETLRNSSQKTDKIVALIWHRKGYYFENYEQWKTQFDMDKFYAAKLKGYTSAQVNEAIDACEESAKKGDFDWKSSTVVKKIGELGTRDI